MTGKSPTKALSVPKATPATAARQRAPSARRKAAARPRLTYLIGSLDRILRRKMTDALAPLGLTLAQFTALSVLEARGEASNAQLAERSFITPQSANEVMSVMASRNWITREPDPNHGRIVVLRLTDEGREVLHRCMATVHVLEAQMLSGIEPRDALAAQGMLELFVRNLRG
ncbi:MarR family winged helix-turn-helix transcriptional regulator [Paraburkholderia diazotrophica]|nr:MarR family transcriptional regulator [Paraburkholderia diazotrophica]